jgi:hypothetical protein
VPSDYPIASGGGGGSPPYHHVQGSPASSWVILHGLGYFPNITVVDSTERQVEGDVVYDNLNQITVTFAAPFSGDAYLS